jgi:transposase-like protein
MESKPRKRYTAEFKAQALELLTTGKPVSQVAQELCISNNLLYYWTSCVLCGAKTPSSKWRTTF